MPEKYKKRSLGKGLDSLFEKEGEEKGRTSRIFEGEMKNVQFEPDRVWKVRIDQVERNPKQPRKDFDKKQIMELANSIKEHGVLQPIVVRRKGDKQFEIVAGERRWRASQLAGLQEVPVVVKQTNEKKSLEMALVENLQRANLNPIEEAKAYELLLKEHNLTQEELAKSLGKERPSVANVLRVLNLDSFVQNLVFENKLSLGHAKVLLTLKKKEEQRLWAKRCYEKQMSVRALELAVKTQGFQKNTEKKNKNSPWEKVREELEGILKTKVRIDARQGGGKVSVFFYSEEQLNQFLDRLRNL